LDIIDLGGVKGATARIYIFYRVDALAAAAKNLIMPPPWI
jgi:hypothetical protein